MGPLNNITEPITHNPPAQPQNACEQKHEEGPLWIGETEIVQEGTVPPHLAAVVTPSGGSACGTAWWPCSAAPSLVLEQGRDALGVWVWWPGWLSGRCF